MCRTFQQRSVNVVEVSYKIFMLIAKNKKSIVSGESLVKLSILVETELVYNKMKRQILESVLSSSFTLVSCQLTRLKKCCSATQ